MQSNSRITLTGLVLLTVAGFLAGLPGSVTATPHTRVEAIFTQPLVSSGPTVGEPDAGQTKKSTVERPPTTTTSIRAEGTAIETDRVSTLSRVVSFWMHRIFGLSF